MAESWLKVPQTKLRTPGLLALLSLIAIMMPLALDMYTPAIPHMSEHLNTTESMVNLTLVGYSLFFSISAIMTALGPFAWTFASRFTTPKRFLTTALLVSLFAGAAMVFTGTASPFLFALLFCVFAVCEAAQRPLTVNILLTQQDECVGTASSLINFILSAAGSLGMLVVHMPAPNYVVALGVTIALSMAVSLAGWFALLRSPISVRGLRWRGRCPQTSRFVFVIVRIHQLVLFVWRKTVRLS
ncbi:MAG: hypothetical protein LIV25_06805 [Olsenella sp.]|nr:hypothetical protein [Olsenella sp.]